VSPRSDFRFLHRLRVRWSECDQQGIVFNVNYFLYYDIAQWEWIRALGYSFKDAPEFLTARIESDFKGAALFDDEIDIALRAGRIGTKSLTFAGAIFRGEELLNVARIAYVYVRKGTRDTAPLDQGLIERILAFEKTSPERGSAR